MSKEELRKLLPMEFYAKEDMKIYTEISLETLNKIMNYISDKEQRIDKTIKELESIFPISTTPIGEVIHLEERIYKIENAIKCLKGDK